MSRLSAHRARQPLLTSASLPWPCAVRRARAAGPLRGPLARHRGSLCGCHPGTAAVIAAIVRDRRAFGESCLSMLGSSTAPGVPEYWDVHSGFAATGCFFSFGDVDCRGGVRRTRIKDGLTRRFRILPVAAALGRCPSEMTSLVKTTLGDAFVLARSAQEARRGAVGREKMLMALACGNVPIGVSRRLHSATGGCAVTLFFGVAGEVLRASL